MIEVKYKCACMKEEATIFVRDRQPAEDLMYWMIALQQALGDDHFVRSPACKQDKVEYTKIPVLNEKKGIGFPLNH